MSYSLNSILFVDLFLLGLLNLILHMFFVLFQPFFMFNQDDIRYGDEYLVRQSLD